MTANFRVFPRAGTSGVTYTGSYTEQDEGWFSGANFQPTPNAEFHVHGTATASDGSTLRLRLSGHVQIDQRTGQVRRDVETLTCTIR